MMKLFLPPLAAILSLAGCGVQPRQPGSADEVAVRRVVESFRLAILAKDKPAYMTLFFSERPGGIGWQAVVDDTTLNRIRLSRPQAIKARPIPANNHVALIDTVVASKSVEEETVSNLAIDTDGEIATASFDYAYVSDGKTINWGKEQWLLVRTERGWKIFSVVYTIRDQR